MSLRVVDIPAVMPGESVGGVQLRSVVAQLNAALDEVQELRDLLAGYAVDEFGAFPAEVDRYFARIKEVS